MRIVVTTPHRSAIWTTHAVALGLVFYTGQMYPSEYSNRLFITQHGTWNRSEKSGYRVLVT